MSRWTIGDSVVVKPGTRDPDLGGDIGGWQGRVVELDQSDEHPDLICIEWDSATLRQMPATMIQQCEEQGMVWTLMWLDAHEVEETTPRDTSEDVARVQEEQSPSVIYHGFSGVDRSGPGVPGRVGAAGAGPVGEPVRVLLRRVWLGQTCR